jgi:hypothetical protein
MASKKFLFVMPGVVLAFGLLAVGCDNGTTDNKEAGVQGLPSFEGTFVESKEEATAMALDANEQITAAIEVVLNAALANGGGGNLSVSPNLHSVNPPNFDVSRAAYESKGHYSDNGIDLDYTVTYSDGFPTPPCTTDMIEKVKINGTYGGYIVVGNYNVKSSISFTSEESITIKADYDCAYAVSKDNKGMKIVSTGNTTMTSDPVSMKYNMHYAVYDNNNVCQFDYDYDVEFDEDYLPQM